jgi:hypothetical protein
MSASANESTSGNANTDSVHEFVLSEKAAKRNDA